MKILIVHNEYGRPSGEEVVVGRQQQLLEAHGHEVLSYMRSSAEIERMPLGRARAFFYGIYNPRTRRELGELIGRQRPDIVHVHNLFPLISPAALDACAAAAVPVVMTLHNYRLLCPHGLLMRAGRICDRCAGGREYRCVLHNCEGTRSKSIGYALRSYIARIRGVFNGVRKFIVLNRFQKEMMAAHGLPADRIEIVPNPAGRILADPSDGPGEYVGFVGRLSPEKGIHLLADVARRCPDIPFRAAGAWREKMARPDIPPNLDLAGQLEPAEMSRFYRGMRFLIVTSICYEAFSLPIIEAMLHGRAVIGPKLAGIPELVEDGISGKLYTAGNAEELARGVSALWRDGVRSGAMGRAGRRKALEEFAAERHYEKLMAIYDKALALNR